MPNHGPSAQNGGAAAAPAREEVSRDKVLDEVQTETGPEEKKTARYNDLQSATRFPLKLAVAVKSKSGETLAETQNISANGVLFQFDSDVPVGSMVDFTICLPAQVVGSELDVHVGCRGRVVRSIEEGGHRQVGVVIDEYKFERM
jgi:PilZ domain